MDLEKAVKHRRDVWAANSITNALAYRNEHDKPYLSVITVMEILRGLHRDIDPAKAERFKLSAPANFQFLDVTTGVSYLASEIIGKLEDARMTIGIADSLIAATAIQHGLVLVTANRKHFQRVVDLGYSLTLQNWREK
ncbi:MAG: type II toxin-antitoxin system VapC family toxin [Alphaproteobacteria bacterium]|nr:MAG: type II toxin-antitoxin system VapC family toxin [Alphaproteobacteria bacterium]